MEDYRRKWQQHHRRRRPWGAPSTTASTTTTTAAPPFQDPWAHSSPSRSSSFGFAPRPAVTAPSGGSGGAWEREEERFGFGGPTRKRTVFGPSPPPPPAPPRRWSFDDDDYQDPFAPTPRRSTTTTTTTAAPPSPPSPRPPLSGFIADISAQLPTLAEMDHRHIRCLQVRSSVLYGNKSNLRVVILVFTFVRAANQSGSSRKVRRLLDFMIGWILFASTMLYNIARTVLNGWIVMSFSSVNSSHALNYPQFVSGREGVLARGRPLPPPPLPGALPGGRMAGDEVTGGPFLFLLLGAQQDPFLGVPAEAALPLHGERPSAL